MGHQHLETWERVGAYPICPHCQSALVVRDASAEWHMGDQDWILKTLADTFACDKCGESLPEPVWKIDEEFRLARIRRLNDQLRIGRGENITIVVTQGVQAFGDIVLQTIIEAIGNFDDFSEDNDPQGEHDFGAIDIDQKKIFWKIDCFDRSMKWGSPDPASAKLTWRVLTIMLAQEY